jgi:hypothetical protein
MSPMVALMAVTWVAIVVLFFALGAVWRELRLIRGLVVQGAGDGFASAAVNVSLGSRFGSDREPRIVVAADSGCPLCLAVIERLSESPAAETATVLTHEQPEVWGQRAGRLQVISDREAWRAISHLAPPVLMLVAGSGTVRRLVLPVNELEVDRVLADWLRRDREHESSQHSSHESSHEGSHESSHESSEEERHDANVGQHS